MGTRYYYTLLGLIPSIIWGATVLVSGKLALAFGPLRAAATELFIAGLFLLVVALYKQSAFPKHFNPKYLFIAGFFWVINNTFFWIAVGKTSNPSQLLVVGLFNYLWPILTLLLSISFLKKVPRKSFLTMGIFVSIAGVILGRLSIIPVQDKILSFSQLSAGIESYIFAFLGALWWAFYSNTSTRFPPAENWSPVWCYMLAGSLILFLFPAPTTQPSFYDWLLILCWSPITGIAFLLWDTCIKKGDPTVISSFSMLIPLLSTVLTAIGTGIGLNIWIVLASVLVVIGSRLSFLSLK